MSEIGAEPWSWPEERWRAGVERARAGRPLRPKKWKGGARCAVALSFDCGFEAAALSRDADDIVAISRGQYGARAGLPRILRLLKRHGVQATFFLPAVSGLLHPDAAKAIVAGGHEIALSSWIGESRAGMAAEAERELLEGARTALERGAGMKPVGLRVGAGGLSGSTIKIARDLGLSYDSSLAADDEPYELTDAGEPTGIIEMPVSLSDAAFFAGSEGMSPQEVFDIFRRELEVAYDEGGLFVLALDPALVGRRSRIWIVDEIVKVARTLPGVWFSTLSDIAAFARGKGGI